MPSKWINRFLDLAKHVSMWSKDPSTKVGSVIIGERNIVIGLGFNGFPRGVLDKKSLYDNREEKLSRVVHAELNAIANATQNVRGATIFTYPFPPCAECTKAIIQFGIRKVIAPRPSPELRERWAKSLEVAEEMLKQAEIPLVLVKVED